MFPEEKMSETKDTMVWVVDDQVAKDVVHDILVPEDIRLFKKKPEILLGQALEFSRFIQHRTLSLEPSFHRTPDPRLW